MDIDIKSEEYLNSEDIFKKQNKKNQRKLEIELSYDFPEPCIYPLFREMVTKLLILNNLEIKAENFSKINSYILDPKSPLISYSIKDEKSRLKINKLSSSRNIMLVVEFFS